VRANSLSALLTPALLLLGLAGFAAPSFGAPASKVDVCHVPPGNPANFHTIRVSENAVPAHLDHGDILGPCDAVCAELCDDGNECTIDDTGDCETAGCPATRDQADCGDGNSCTADSCDPAQGCTNLPLEDDPCSVENPGTCFLNTGFCDSGGTCVLDAEPGCCLTDEECADDNLCDSEVCDNNACRTDQVTDCGGNACEVGLCDPATGACNSTPVVCDDQDLCTTDSCDAVYGCQFDPNPDCCLHDSECSDGNNCTADACVANRCEHEPCPDAAGDACNVLVDCDPDTCAPILDTVSCADDGNQCTLGECVDPGGCVTRNFDDGFPCQLADPGDTRPATCQMGQCVGEAQRNFLCECEDEHGNVTGSTTEACGCTEDGTPLPEWVNICEDCRIYDVGTPIVSCHPDRIGLSCGGGCFDPLHPTPTPSGQAWIDECVQNAGCPGSEAGIEDCDLAFFRFSSCQSCAITGDQTQCEVCTAHALQGVYRCHNLCPPPLPTGREVVCTCPLVGAEFPVFACDCTSVNDPSLQQICDNECTTNGAGPGTLECVPHFSGLCSGT